jgi:hypothetical protein
MTLEQLVKKSTGALSVSIDVGAFLAIVQAILAAFQNCQNAPDAELIKRVRRPRWGDMARLRNTLRSNLELRGSWAVRRRADEIADGLEKTAHDADDEELAEALAEIRGG